MLSTPKKHLPKGYPLPSPEENKKFENVFTRAFEIHKTAHDFESYPQYNGIGGLDRLGPRQGILSPVRGQTKVSRAQYCDCYERAYRELNPQCS